jgi:hypothetical protein
MCCCRDQRRQLSSLAQALKNVSEAPPNLRRADIGLAVPRRPQRGRLAEVWTAARVYLAVDFFLPKPFDDELLVESVRAALER